MIQSAPIRPSPAAWNSSTAFSPGPAARFGACQKPRSASTSAGRSQSRCPARVVARAPTSRPPMALGWPVTLKGPAPGWPMLPVSRWQLMIALALSVPLLDWLVPWLNRVTVRGVAANQSKKVRQQRRVQARSRPPVRPRRGSAASSPGARRCGGRSACRCAEQPVEQRDIAAGRQRQVQVGALAGRGAARVDHHHPHRRPRRPRRLQPLEQHRMAPGEVAADQHDEVGQLQILVDAGHQILAEGPAVPGHGAGHAEPRVAVDVAGAEEALCQLVRGEIILGQQLARDVERDAGRAMLRQRARGSPPPPHPAPHPSSPACHPPPGAAAAPAGPASRPARCPCCTAGRDWPDAPGRRAPRPSGETSTPQPTPQ